MGDGYVRTCSKKPFIAANMIARTYLEHLSSEVFPICSKDVTLKRTAQEMVEKNRDNGFRPNAKVENYSDIYSWGTVCHPELRQYEKWYSTGEKVFPEDIDLTPTVLKHWHCGDGSLQKGKWAVITLTNERENKDKIENIFNRVGLEDFFWDEYERANKEGYKCEIVFRQEGTKNFFEHIGKPLPGFKYKWPENRR